MAKSLTKQSLGSKREGSKLPLNLPRPRIKNLERDYKKKEEHKGIRMVALTLSPKLNRNEFGYRNPNPKPQFNRKGKNREIQVR
jgi:hypothetical protein